MENDRLKLKNIKKTATLLVALFLVVLVGYFVGRGEERTREDEPDKDEGVVMGIDLPENYQEPMIIKTFGQILEIMPLGAMAAEKEELPDGTIFYREAYHNTDVEQIKYMNKLKESLILKSANHPEKFEYQIDTQNFDWVFDGEGNIIISSKKKEGQAIPSTAGGEISKERMQQYAHEQAKVFKIPKPFMVEEGKNEKGEVGAEIFGNKLVLTPDREWIKNHQYPIVVDPTVEKMPKMIQELAEKRSYNSLTFLNDDGSYTTMAHVGHINYKDNNDNFQPADTSLSETESGWEQDQASYRSVFPKYADDWMEFENMYEGGGASFKMKPVANRVSGELITDERDIWHDKKVVYKDAFGVGNDLELIAGNVALFKYVKLNQKPLDLSQDIEFDFELGLKEGEKLIIDGQEWNGIDEVITSEQIGIVVTGGSASYLRKFTVWDTKGQSESIKIKISRRNDKIYFTKILPKEFLISAEYPVYTDASATYYPGAVDGHIGYSNTSWATCRGASDGDSVSNTRTDRQWARSDYADPDYEITRLFFPVNTADLSDVAVISAASLNLYGGYIRTWDNDSYDYSVVVQTSQASETALSTADYDQVGSTAGSSTYDTSALTEGGWNSLSLNATGLTWISKTGYTKIGVREGHDMANHAAAGRTTHEYAPSESANDPYLSVTYTANATPSISSVADSPDPVNAGSDVTFSVNWADDDAGENVKVKICKTDVLSSQNCSGGYWATSTSFTTDDPKSVTYTAQASDVGVQNYYAYVCDDEGACVSSGGGTAGTFTVNVIGSISTVVDTPDPTNPGRSVSFIVNWDDAGDSVKIKVCKTNALTSQNCDGGYWASSTDFTTADPATLVYDVVSGDAGQTRDYWVFVCDNGGLCTSSSSGSFSVNAQSVVPNVKIRGGTIRRGAIIR